MLENARILELHKKLGEINMKKVILLTLFLILTCLIASPYFLKYIYYVHYTCLYIYIYLIYTPYTYITYM